VRKLLIVSVLLLLLMGCATTIPPGWHDGPLPDWVRYELTDQMMIITYGPNEGKPDGLTKKVPVLWRYMDKDKDSVIILTSIGNVYVEIYYYDY
jgi:hypothetical protein